MIHLVTHYIHTHKLLSPAATVIVGVSGGADSMALLYILKEIGYNCVVAHCNFTLRQKESDADESFVVDYCRTNNLPCLVKHFDTKKHAQDNKISIEMAARELRYGWFETLRLRYQAEAIAIAHHFNDSIETILINLINGTGINGLTGIKPINGHIIRPLLCVNRKEIEDFLQKKHLHFITDSSNVENIYTRNKIRNILIPQIEEINPSFINTMQGTIHNLTTSATIYNSYIELKLKDIIESSSNNQVKISINQLLKEEHADTVLYEALKTYNFSPKLCASILNNVANSGKEYLSPTHKLLIDRDFIFLTPIKEKNDTHTYYIQQSDSSIEFPIKLNINILRNDASFHLSKKPTCACIDYSLLKFPLTIRRWKKGERFYPLGMKQSKKVSDFFVDNKIPTWEKEKCWIIESNGNIVWIIGYRLDDRYKVTTSTSIIFKISVKE